MKGINIKSINKTVVFMHILLLLFLSAKQIPCFESGNNLLDIAAGIALMVLCGLILYLTELAIHQLCFKEYWKIILRVGTLLLSVIIFICILLPKVDNLYDEVTVTVECGERGEKAFSAEVWISGWRKGGVEYASSSLDVVEIVNINYRADHNSYIFTNSDGSGYGKIVFKFSGKEQNELIFNQHRWCGIVTITDSNGSEVIDLYADVSSKYSHQIPQGKLKPLTLIFDTILLYITLCYTVLQFAFLSLLGGVLGLIKWFKVLFRGSTVDRTMLRDRFLNNFALACSGSAFPITYLLFQFNQNPGEVNFLLLLAACGFITIFSLAIFIVVSGITHSALVAYISDLMFAMFLFGSGFIRTGILSMESIGDMGELAMLLSGGIAAAIISIAIWKLRRIKFDSLITIGITVLTLFLIAMNVPTAIHSYSRQQSVASELCTKTSFVVSESTERLPNIYWFHCDGMLGFSAVEKYYGDAQDDFKTELAARGFSFDSGSNFESGHATAAAIPSLLCPGFYDNYLSSKILSEPNLSNLHNAFDGPEFSEVLRIARLNNETITAFTMSPYQTSIIAPLNWGTTGTYYPPISESFYEPASGKIFQVDTDPNSLKEAGEVFSSTSFFKLESFLHTLVLPLSELIEGILPRGFDSLIDSFGDTEVEKKEIATTTYDSINIPSTQALSIAMECESAPYFFVIPHDIAHNPYVYDESGERVNVSSMDVTHYLPQHKYAVKVLLNAVDTILAKDPDAVIVLQADHGLHGNTQAEFVNAFGENAVAKELWNCVISAIRVPEQYQNGEEVYAIENPLNISRYLVNRFVGQNYDYLPANEPLIP